MRGFILAGAGALAMLSTSVAAQDAVVAADGETYVLTDDQQTMYDGWPADRQTAYDGWPSEVQEYYWTLTPVQNTGWWVLTDDQRVRIYEMTPEQRAQAWTQIAAQMPAGSTAGTATSMPATSSSSSSQSPRFVRKEVTQATPTGYAAATGDDIPVCKAGQQDGCINSWEKNRTGTRPLDYWPGRPASEIEGPIPPEKPSN